MHAEMTKRVTASAEDVWAAFNDWGGHLALSAMGRAVPAAQPEQRGCGRKAPLRVCLQPL